MGLRVGAGASNLTEPSPGDTLAGLKEAASIPANTRLPQMRAPASGPTPTGEQPPGSRAPAQYYQENVFDKMAAAQSQPSPNGPPPESFAEKAKGAARMMGLGPEMDVAQMLAEHGTIVGATAGQVAGGMVAGPPGAVIGSGVVGSLGQKLENFVKGEPQPSLGDSVKTAGALAAAGAAGEYLLSPIGSAIGNKLINAGKPAFEALSPAMEKAGQTLRNSAKDLLNYVGDRFPVFKHELMGEAPAAATAENDLSNLASYGTESQKQQLYVMQKQRADAIFHDLSVLHNVLPKPENIADVDPAELKGFIVGDNGWIARHGQQVGQLKGQISNLIGDQKADVSGFLDGIGAELRQKLIIDRSGKVMRSVSPDQQFLVNFYKDMMQITGQPASERAGTDMAWNQIADQLKLGRDIPLPVPGVNFHAPDVSGPGRSISMDDFNTMLKRLQSAAVEQGGEILPALSKDMTNRYYGMMADKAAAVGKPEVASALMKANQEYTQLIDFAGDLGRQITKNPDAAVTTMVSRTNPNNTAMMMRMLTPQQQQVMSRAFLSSAVQNAFDASTGTISAKDVLKQVGSYGDKNLTLLFGNEKAQVLGALNKLTLLQNTNLSFAAQEKVVGELAKDAARSSTVKGLWRTAIDWYSGKTSNVADMLGSQEFADKMFKMQTGMASSKQLLMQGIGKALPSAAAKAPTVLGGEVRSIIGSQNAERQMREEQENPFNQPQTRDFNR